MFKERVNNATGSAFLELRLDPQKEASAQGVLVIEVKDKNTPSGDQQIYLFNLATPTTKTVITKPIDILIGGNKGYEFYLESSGIKGFLSSYQSILGKNRVIQFSKEGKDYLIFSPMEDPFQLILNTLTFK